MDENQKEANHVVGGHTNPAMEMDSESSTPQSNNNRKIRPTTDIDNNMLPPNKHPALVVFEDLPYEPSAFMDRLEGFRASLSLAVQKRQKLLKLLSLIVLTILYNCYFFGAVSYYIQYKVIVLYFQCLKFCSVLHLSHNRK